MGFACARSLYTRRRNPLDVTGATVFLVQTSPGSVPGVGDAVAIGVGALLTALVIYAIVAANLRAGKRRP